MPNRLDDKDKTMILDCGLTWNEFWQFIDLEDIQITQKRPLTQQEQELLADLETRLKPW